MLSLSDFWDHTFSLTNPIDDRIIDESLSKFCHFGTSKRKCNHFAMFPVLSMLFIVIEDQFSKISLWFYVHPKVVSKWSRHPFWEYFADHDESTWHVLSWIKTPILLFVKIQSHSVVFEKILDLSFFICELTFFILKLFLRDDPIIVDFLSLLLEVVHQFLLLFVDFLQVSQLFSHGQLNYQRKTLNSSDYVSFTAFDFYTASCSNSLS